MDLNGKELILDADADTSITADTDDTIDIRIAGADDFQFTANSFNVLSGSTLTIDSGATIANSGTATGFAAQGRSVRPLIINGDMDIAQRTASAVTGLGDGDEGYVTVDRIRHTIDGTTAGRFTSSQGAVSDLPGFVKCIQIDCTTADTSIAAGEGFNLEYKFEGKDLTLLEKGHSTARPFTIAFYAKADAAVTYSVEFKDTDNNRHCTRAFTTTTGWTRHVLNFPADTTGKYNHDVNHSASLRFWLHAGSNFTSGTAADVFQGVTTANTVRDIGSIFASTDRTIQITGVQMEIGTFTSDTIPDFQHETFAESKTRCQRYFIGDSELVPTTQITASTAIQLTPQFRTEMRASPTATHVATGGFGLVGGSYTTTSLAVSNIGVNGGRAAVNMDTSNGSLLQLCQQGLPMTLDAEL